MALCCRQKCVAENERWSYQVGPIRQYTFITWIIYFLRDGLSVEFDVVVICNYNYNLTIIIISDGFRMQRNHLHPVENAKLCFSQIIIPFLPLNCHT